MHVGLDQTDGSRLSLPDTDEWHMSGSVFDIVLPLDACRGACERSAFRIRAAAEVEDLLNGSHLAWVLTGLLSMSGKSCKRGQRRTCNEAGCADALCGTPAGIAVEAWNLLEAIPAWVLEELQGTSCS